MCAFSAYVERVNHAATLAVVHVSEDMEHGLLGEQVGVQGHGSNKEFRLVETSQY